MKKKGSATGGLRPRPMSIDAPLPIFWGPKAPGDALEFEPVGTRVERVFLPAWKEVKTYKKETQSGFKLPKNYIQVIEDEDRVLTYALDIEDQKFLARLRARIFKTDRGAKFTVSESVFTVTLDYLQKLHNKYKDRGVICPVGLDPYENINVRFQIENINGCILPDSVFHEICLYWKAKREEHYRKLNAEYTKLYAMRQGFEKVRMLLDSIKKREKIKHQLSTEELAKISALLKQKQRKVRLDIVPATKKPAPTCSLKVTKPQTTKTKQAATPLLPKNNSIKKDKPKVIQKVVPVAPPARTKRKAVGELDTNRPQKKPRTIRTNHISKSVTVVPTKPLPKKKKENKLLTNHTTPPPPGPRLKTPSPKAAATSSSVRLSQQTKIRKSPRLH